MTFERRPEPEPPGGSRRVDPFGELLLLLAAPSVLPMVGAMVAPAAGLGAMVLGLQILLGRPEPWVPARYRGRLGRSRTALRLRIWIQRRLRPLAHLRVPAFPRGLAGAAAILSGGLLALPLPVIPFANVIPSLAMGLVGAALVTRKPLFGWSGLLLAGGFAALVAALGGTVVVAVRRLMGV